MTGATPTVKVDPKARFVVATKERSSLERGRKENDKVAPVAKKARLEKLSGV